MGSLVKKASRVLAAVVLVALLCIAIPTTAIATDGELITLRTESSKTYQLGDGQYKAVFWTGIVHYKDNYASGTELWKEVNPVLKDGKVTGAPYNLEVKGDTYTMTDKRTGDSVAITPGKIGELSASKDNFNVALFNEGFRLQREIRTKDDPMTAEFGLVVAGDSVSVRSEAYDADGNSVPMVSTIDKGKLVESIDTGKVDVNTVKYPLTVDPVVTLYPSGTSDGQATSTVDNTTWATRVAANGTGTVLTGGVSQSVLYFLSGTANDWKSNRRGCFFIDTSSLPDTSVVSSATFSVYGRGAVDQHSATPNLGLYNTTSTNTAITTEDYELSGSTLLSDTIVTYGSWPNGAYIDFPLNSTGLSAISLDGWSRFVIRNPSYDVAASDPPRAGNTMWTKMYLDCSEAAGSDTDPKLEITYTVAPTVTTQAASAVGETTATGNANITDTGGENADHRGVVYGTTSLGDPGNVAPALSGYDDFEDEAGSFGTGAFTASLTGLTPGATYYYRGYAHNSAGYVYGSEESFTTTDPPVAVDPGVTIIRSLLRLVVASVILIGVVASIGRGGIAPWVSVMVGIIAFGIIDALINLI